MTPTGRPPEEFRGWKEIALALQVSVRRAKELADRDPEEGGPLPVWHDHRGVYAIRSRLQDWVDAENVHHKVHLRLLRSRAEKRPARRAKAG